MKNLSLIFFFFFLSFGSQMFSQCKSPDEKQVTNINEIKNFVNFDTKKPIKERKAVVGYKITAGIGKGHRRSGGCCQFNGGWCGRFDGYEILVDNNGQITKSVIKIFKGTSNGKEYVRYEGLSANDMTDEPASGIK